MLRLLSLLLCASALTATARASDPVTPPARRLTTVVPAAPALLRPLDVSGAARSQLERAALAVAGQPSRFVRGRRVDAGSAALPSLRLQLPDTEVADATEPLDEVALPDAVSGTFAVRDSERPGGQRTEVLLDAEVLVVPFVESDRDEPAANCRAGGRVMAGTAGLALQAGELWACRMQMTRQALHSFTGETMARRYSLALQRRF